MPMGRMKDTFGDRPYQHPHAQEFMPQDPFEGLERREKGVRRMEERFEDYMTKARMALKNSGLDYVTSDDLHRLFPLPEGVHHNAIGAVFLHSLFARTDHFIRSTRPDAHGRMIRKWRVRRRASNATPANSRSSAMNAGRARAHTRATSST